MERQELLEKLHRVTFAAFLTALTSEECLEAIIMTSEGTSYSWISYDEWNIYCISKSEVQKLSPIKEKLLEGILSETDISGTCFERLSDVEFGGDNVQFLFSDFAEKKFDLNNEIYCFFDENDKKYYFFSTEEEIAVALGESYVADTLWEDMDIGDLASWLERYETEGEIPYCYIGRD